jgi:succinate dehydrogenase / fumarate reductase cytochrome b subunit
MDTNQKNAEKLADTKFGIPILYLTELFALAMGVKPDEIGLKFHRSRLTALLEKYKLK